MKEITWYCTHTNAHWDVEWVTMIAWIMLFTDNTLNYPQLWVRIIYSQLTTGK